jgi:Xaa-Pro aminopeptidase
MERRLRALDVARQAGVEALLVSKPASVVWLTGFAAEVDSGPSPFSLPPLVLLAGDEPPVLIVSDDDAEGAAVTGCEVRSYRGFSVEPLDAVGGA